MLAPKSIADNWAPLHSVSVSQAKHVISAVEAVSILLRWSLGALKLKAATINQKAARDEALSADESERVIGIARLVGQLEAIIEEARDPGEIGCPTMAVAMAARTASGLGGIQPLPLLDTMEGQTLVFETLAQIQSGVLREPRDEVADVRFYRNTRGSAEHSPCSKALAYNLPVNQGGDS